MGNEGLLKDIDYTAQNWILSGENKSHRETQIDIRCGARPLAASRAIYSEVQCMNEHRAVCSSRELSKRIAFYLETSDPAGYPPDNWAETIHTINDILQGRSQRTPDGLLAEVADKGSVRYSGEISILRRDVQDFLAQKTLLETPYTKSSGKQYKHRIYQGSDGRPLKIINQQLFDWAAKAGFPPGFFRESYFDRVTVYCLPDYADCNFSVFQSCKFAVCRIQDVQFDGTSIYSSEFHTCRIERTTFFAAIVANTHFYDSTLNWVSFQKSRLNSCNTIDCTMQNVGFLYAALDGCCYGRVAAEHIRYLDTAVITQGGATLEECAQNRESIIRNLCPQLLNVSKTRTRKRGIR